MTDTDKNLEEIDAVIKGMFAVDDKDVFLEWVDENRHELDEIVKSAFGDVKTFKHLI